MAKEAGYDTVRDIVIDVLSAENNSEVYARYQLARPFLKGWKFLLASEAGGAPYQTLDQEIAGTAVIRGLFRTSNVLLLDEQTECDMHNGTGIPVDYSVSLDTQAASYLRTFFMRDGDVPSSFKEVLQYIADPDTNVDIAPYLIENSSGFIENDRGERILETVASFEFLKNLDLEKISTNGEFASVVGNADLIIRAQRLISEYIYDGIIESSANLYKPFYCLLLKMAEIQFGKRGAPLSKKMEHLIEFQHNTLASLWTRETVLGRNFFERGQNVKFMRKVQVKKSGLFEDLKNMAWDMWHVRYCEKLLTAPRADDARYYIPCILTFDAGMAEMIDMYSLRACAIPPHGEGIIPVIEKEKVTGSCTASEYMDKFFTKEAQEDRRKRHNDRSSIIAETIISLEKEVSRLAGI